jgi:carbamoyl-phosphate synthase / aspartate carbamoyltransferase / dihydroorotase
MIRLPGLIDPHIHVREPGAVHKEDWDTATQAALAGGFTLVLAMPNTQPPIVDRQSLAQVNSLAAGKARCDYAQFLGGGENNSRWPIDLPDQAAGLKLYLDQTYGPLKLDEMPLWMEHMANWPAHLPVSIHAEGRSIAAAILIASFYDRPVHICHVSRKEEILLIRAAKEHGLKVTSEVTPHHLFLCEEDISRIGTGRSEVRPRLAEKADQQALWDNLSVIDCFATDHAPHTLSEKDSPTPPPGFPGLESALPLLLTAVHQGRLTLEDLIQRMVTNPRQIYHLPEQPDTWIEIDPETRWEIHAGQFHSRCGWTPFENQPVQGRVEKVVLRGQTAFENGQILVAPGFGQNIKPSTEQY